MEGSYTHRKAKASELSPFPCTQGFNQDPRPIASADSQSQAPAPKAGARGAAEGDKPTSAADDAEHFDIGDSDLGEAPCSAGPRAADVPKTKKLL